MKENTKLHQLGGDTKHERKNGHVIRGHVMWLYKIHMNPEKVCKQLFSLSWDSG